MSKTIKQIADELGVSKPTISRLISDLGIEPFKVGNRFELSDYDSSLIKSQISQISETPQSQKSQKSQNEKSQQSQQSQQETQQSQQETQKSQKSQQETQTTANLPQTECENDVDRRKPPQTEFAVIVEVLQTTIDTLQGQLAAKDEQIKTQQEQISALQSELERERQHARNQAEKLAVLADQAQQLHAADKKALLAIEDKQDPPKRHWWQRKRKEQTEE